jgi:hypothetical protein
MDDYLLLPVKQAFSVYMREWYAGLYATTNGMTEFVARGHEKSLMWAPGRMVDAAEEMLASYMRNTNSNVPGANSLFPIVLIAQAKDYMPTGADWGGRQVSRKEVAIEDDEGSSVYGYRQAMGDLRSQVVIAATEDATAKSLAAQFCLYVGDISNRRFYANFTFGEYTIPMPVMIENPDIMFMEVKTDAKNMTMLAADVDLKITVPFFDAPAENDENDGSDHEPPGYQVVQKVVSSDLNTGVDGKTEVGVSDEAVVWGKAGDFDEPEPPVDP